MDYLTDKGFSTRLSCRVVGLSRSSYQRARRQRAKRSGNPSADRYHLLREWMNEFADTHRRWGYRRGLVHARGAGFSVSRDVFRRLWREENLRVFPRKQRKQVISHNPEPRKGAAEKPGEIWALDFQFDSDYTGRAFKICNVIDEFSRKHVTFSLARSISAADVVEMLDVAVLEHGCPKVLRMDNGPEFIAGKLRDWVDEQQLTQAFIPPLVSRGITGLWSRFIIVCVMSCWLIMSLMITPMLPGWWRGGHKGIISCIRIRLWVI